ncbi:MAG TPA: hypothetical protein VGE63_00115 [Candidatus Paceibacterota bacterium]
MSKGVKIILVLLVIILIGVALKMKGVIGGKTAPTTTETTQTQTETGQPSDAAAQGDQAGQLSEKEVQKYVKAVNKIWIGLPAEEQPIVAKIIDVEKLRAEQQFYKDAANDDVLVIYPSVAKAIIYRPSTNQIVNAGPLIVNQDEKATGQQQTSTQTSAAKQ